MYQNVLKENPRRNYGGNYSNKRSIEGEKSRKASLE